MAIAAVGGSNANGNLVSTVTAAYSPTAGDTVCLFIHFFPNLFTGLTVQDNLGNALTPGPTITYSSGNQASYAFYQNPVPSGVTGYVASWATNTSHAAMVLEEYSGVSSINVSISGNSGSGSATPVALSVTTEDANDLVVFSFADQGGGPFTVTTGTLRQTSTSALFTNAVLVDSSVASPGTCTGAATYTLGGPWTGVAIELRTPRTQFFTPRWVSV
jgi:hypothetical protein